MTRAGWILAAAFVAALTTGERAVNATLAAQRAFSIPTDGEIRAFLADRVDRAKQSVGLVVGIIDANGRRIVSYGPLTPGDTRALNGDTEFEIGSITKVFTSLILADMVEKGEVALDDPVAKYLPSSVKVPGRSGKPITLLDLATHSSGLPRMASNAVRADPDNPYADYTVDQMYAFLSGYTLPRDPGAQFEYSNLGVGLLGHVLSLRAGTDYETLVRQRVLAPLGMKDTAIALTPDMAARLAVGHDTSFKPVKNWDLPTFAGAGALRSTANDALTFLGAKLGLTNTTLKDSMARQLAVRRPAIPSNTQIALGWMVLTVPEGTVFSHSGSTGGYRAYMGFNPAARTGVVVLANTAVTNAPEDIGTRLALGVAFPKVRTEIALDLKTKQGFVGQYQLSPTAVFSITLEGQQLFAQLTGQSKHPVFPEAPNQIFYRVVDAQITFHVGADGKATGLTLHQNGRDLQARRKE